MSRRKLWVSFNTLTIALMMVLGLSLGSIAFAQEVNWNAITNQALALSRQGKHREALPLAKKALKIAERNFSPDDTLVALSLNNLAEVYRALGQYAKAEPLLKRAMAIREKALGPDHPHVAQSLKNFWAVGNTAPPKPTMPPCRILDSSDSGSRVL